MLSGRHLRQPLLLAWIAALAACATAAPAPPAASSLAAFEQTLAAHDSATRALTQWCERHRIAEPARIVALLQPGAAAPATPAIRARLEADDAEPIVYRRVNLACGDEVLSQAQNWYVPGRLTAQMNHALDTSETPFGTVVAPLEFRRERLAARRGASEPCPPGTILSHHALLRLPDGRPISLLVECYTPANLAH